MLTPDPSLSPEAAHRLDCINQELTRLYPAICVPGSTEQAAFMRLYADECASDPERALDAAFLACGGEEANACVPCSPVLHPGSVVEQLCSIRLWEVDFVQATAKTAFEFLQDQRKTVGAKMRANVEGAVVVEDLFVNCLVPATVLLNPVSLSFRGATLAEAFRQVAEAVGLSVRLLAEMLAVCSEGVAVAFDASERDGYQTPTWEMRQVYAPRRHAIPAQEWQGICRHYPRLKVPGSAERTRFDAHFLLCGTAENAWTLADRLFARETAQAAGTTE